MPSRAAVSTATFNYVRNSVKVTVDAYNGTINFYVVDPKDPIIRAYEKAFPRPRSRLARNADGAAQAHLRYPEDLFRAQTEQYQRLPPHRHAEFYRGRQPVGGRAEPGDRHRHATSTATDGGRRQQRRAATRSCAVGHGSTRST